MTEDDARAWLRDHFDVSRETVEQLEAYAALVRIEQAHQNLVSAATLPTFWSRHIVDSAQLILLGQSGSWLDVGSGAGMPGIVTAILTRAPTILVEPRARRAAFLRSVIDRLALDHVQVVALPVEKLMTAPVANITARAVAPLLKLLEIAGHCADSATVWLLPKGKTAQSELASLPRAWQTGWEMRASVTDPTSHILVGRHIRMNGKR